MKTKNFFIRSCLHGRILSTAEFDLNYHEGELQQQTFFRPVLEVIKLLKGSLNKKVLGHQCMTCLMRSIHRKQGLASCRQIYQHFWSRCLIAQLLMDTSLCRLADNTVCSG